MQNIEALVIFFLMIKDEKDYFFNHFKIIGFDQKIKTKTSFFFFAFLINSI